MRYAAGVSMVLALGMTFASPRAALAQEAASAGVDRARISEAERYAEEAFDAYEHHEYEKAIALYQRALSAAPSADILYNIARVYDLGLADREAAIDYYRRYIAHARAQRPRSELARQRIAELRAAPAPLDEGRAEAAAPPPAAAAPGVSASQPASAWTARELSAAAFAGAGVLSLGVGAGFAISAYAQRDAWRSDCEGNLCSSQRGVDAARTAARQADVATVALIAGAGLVGVGATLWWVRPDRERAGSAGLVQLRAVAGAGELGGVLEGTF